VDFDNRLRRIRDVFALVGLGAALSTIVSSTIGILVLGFSGALPLSKLGEAWLSWWMGDAMGDLVFAPVFLIWLQKQPLQWSGPRTVEAALLCLFIFIGSQIVFGGWWGGFFGKYPIAFITFPFVIWAGLRFGQRGTTSVVLFLTLIALYNVTQEKGMFAYRSLLESHTLLWLYANLLGATGMLIAASISERRIVEDRISHIAQHDALTGLPNRILLQDRIQQALTHAVRHQAKMSVLFIDLDRFKAVNDTLGHDVGDELLEGVAERLRQCVREADTVARLGGDEFVIVLSDIIQPQNAGQIAQKIIDSLSGVYLLRGYELHVTPSIGISIYPEDGEDAQSLMKNADTAMYTAKQVGASFRYYAAEMNASAFQRMTVENSLRHALERNELSLHYQPLVNLESGKVTGVEALLRWHHPELGMVTPDMFIPIAEESSLIIPIGEWVLGEACRQIKHWREAGYPDLRVAVNISSRQLWQPNLVDTILRIVAESGADAAGLELELTESMLMRHTEETVAMLTKLRDHGIRLAVDDFGTGYSSLAYLKSFPIHTLKIDRSFIRDISEDPNDAAITSAIIAMAHSLSLGVIAEGVETAAQLAYIRGQGCDEAQGFYFSKPLPADQFWDVLQKS